MTAPPFYAEILDVGDRLEAAVRGRDLDAAQGLLAERARLIERASEAEASPSEEDAQRYRAHEVRLRGLLASKLAATRQALEETGRVVAAGSRYAARANASGRLDTAPR